LKIALKVNIVKKRADAWVTGGFCKYFISGANLARAWWICYIYRLSKNCSFVDDRGYSSAG
jgi:hypothetical protein